MPDDICCDDPSRHCDNTVPRDHNDGGQELTKRGYRRNISITDCRHGDNGPIDADRNTGKSGIFFIFNGIHKGPEDNRHGDDRKQKHCDLVAAFCKCLEQKIRLADILDKFQDPKDPQHPQNANHDEILSFR